MMEFEEIRKVWDEQKGETMYVINESALHKSVTRKKNAVSRKMNRLEIMITVINSMAGIYLIILMRNKMNIWGCINVGIMAATIAYIQYFRRKRKKAENTFDRSMVGELDHALSNANSMIRFNYLMIVGYIIPMCVIALTSMVVSEASWEKWLFILGMFLLSFFLVRWEQKACNIPRKKQLLALREKLTEE